ncbi:MAG: hypothetical protein A2942_01370 [Candidatus Lloydbacteria bacterium RIFCSPLOWO2_01_FULL_50_20]|uniref:HNH nuclease domain-containing protein n=1 Tax=Candidatus Lloydbacteria bacterium RIFCSPLOWO2_01_FULL_50_20 TaxID=1798665 RepID=A0A1G2DIY9_9BACT|nr:MAG: hypothetical protein A2942_01370 [Candidatus Lloydbacteria bacterium RIFCSPLOWO2_01_FULL_50_20]
MSRHKKWDEASLRDAVHLSTNRRQVLHRLGLVEAGGNYEQIKRHIKECHINTDHFLSVGANKGRKIPREPVYSLTQILTKNNNFQSYKLKKRLFAEGRKEPKCEQCSWATISPDGRLPLELDHINGDRYDNRITNLRILCPNCHSLQPTHRGRNKKRG